MSIFKKKVAPQWVTVLARYNSERARGIVHNSNWKWKMRRLQWKFEDGYELVDKHSEKFFSWPIRVAAGEQV